MMKIPSKLEPVSFLAGIGFSGLLASGQTLVASVANTGVVLGFWMRSIPFSPSPWMLGAMPLVLGAAEVMAREVSPRLDGGSGKLSELQRRHSFRFPFLPVTDGDMAGSISGGVTTLTTRAESGEQNACHQLAERWQGLHAETPYRMTILALLGYRAVGDEAGYRTLRNQLACLVVALPRSEADGDRVSEKCRRWAVRAFDVAAMSAWLKELTLRHSRSTTVLMGALASARKQGVVSTAEFGWLKSVDRPLFFALDAVGRPIPLPEGLSSATHYAAELQAGKGLPEVDWSIPVAAARRHLDRK